MKQGIYYGMPTEVYHKDPCEGPSLNQSTAKILLTQSPAHAKCQHPRFAESVEDDRDETVRTSMVIGNAAHKMLLSRGAEIVVARDEAGEEFNDWKKKAAQEFRDESRRKGKIVLLGKHYRQAQQIMGAAKLQIADSQANDVFTNGKAEVVIIWQEDGFWFRSMIDYLHTERPICDDLKTVSGSASPDAVPWIMDDHGWNIQAAFQERGLNILDPANIGRRRFRFVALEQKSPHGLTINEMSEAELTIGRQKVDRAIKIWKGCMLTGIWPMYPTTTQYPQTPGNRIAQWEAKEIEYREGDK